LSSSIASRARCCGPPIASRRPPSQASTGPSTPNRIPVIQAANPPQRYRLRRPHRWPETPWGRPVRDGDRRPTLRRGYRK
jgi:hypothetical protein